MYPGLGSGLRSAESCMNGDALAIDFCVRKERRSREYQSGAAEFPRRLCTSTPDRSTSAEL